MIGIYKITNKINGNSYIGQSINVEKRLLYHKKYRNELIKNKVLYKAIEKYGIENFDFEILEECKKEELNEREKYYIEKYNTYYKGYNMTRGGDGKSGCGFSEKTIEKMRKSLIEYHKKNPETKETKGKRIKSLKEYYKNHPEAAQKIAERNKNRSKESFLYAVKKAAMANQKKVYQYDIKGNFVKEYNSIISACKEAKCSATAITQVCHGKNHTAAGFIWSYEYKGERIQAIIPRVKTVLQFDLEGNFIKQYRSTRQAERETGIIHNYISECCRGKRLKAGGFKWAYQF